MIWHYSLARMSLVNLRVHHKDREVWSAEWVQPNKAMTKPYMVPATPRIRDLDRLIVSDHLQKQVKSDPQLEFVHPRRHGHRGSRNLCPDRNPPIGSKATQGSKPLIRRPLRPSLKEWAWWLPRLSGPGGTIL